MYLSFCVHALTLQGSSLWSYYGNWINN